ncbi:hypothetical protein T265_14423 [Opisthorchis viverrini]|uniref:phosphoacetylglucosamine mutase n=1 Tax=Opisthorchis viverrini TaxID=6198 RepID=A0A074ZM71_OPIVI|nr:hypothetical protein T265_14423 [Opisthorchis viverrini]KER24470.1 hypothetical protein T265_14423 [Opisthorchis viverrini]
MATATIRKAVADALTGVCIPTPFCLAYGTAGFRCFSEKLKGVSLRVGVLAALRSLLRNGKFVGVMITASHNPSHDNGIKIVDPDGGMLETNWESVVVDFMHCNANLTAHWIEKRLKHVQDTLTPHVVVGYDTRESSPSLAEEVVQGVHLMQGLCTQLGLITTPQLHYAVRYMNTATASEPSDYLLQPDLDRVYIEYFASQFTAGMNALTTESVHTRHPIELNVDCAHGVGSLALAKLNATLAQCGQPAPIRFRLFNTEVNKRELLNSNCGADFVKITLKAPELYPSDMDASCSLEARWATIDGDADRLLYFYHTPETGPDDLLHPSRIVLLDGDRIACLFASFLTTILRESLLTERFKVGVVQTAYANASSTLYLRDELTVTVLCVPTGVKHLHRAALDFDFGIYFEANGHGTVLFSDAVIEYARQNLDPIHPLAVFIGLTNTTVGDAIADILLVEFVLSWHGWSLKQWHDMYTELASRQIKVSVSQPSSIQTTDAERRVCSPLALQGSLQRPATIRDSHNLSPALRTDDSVRHASVLRAASARHMVPTSSGISKSVLKPRHLVYLAAFNVRTLKQAGQQAALALTLDSLGIDVCCVSETRIQDASTVIELTAPSVSTRFWLLTSGDPEAAAAGCAGESIDDIVHSVERATKAPGKSRAFVRPSGTENIARVYAESIDQTWADWLAQKVAVATHHFVGGDQQPADPGPMPTFNQ